MTTTDQVRPVAFAVAGRSLRRLLTSPALLLPPLLFPLFMLAANAGGLSKIAGVPGFHFAAGYTAFQFVFVLLQSSAFAGVFTGFSVAADFESGFARRLMLAAPRRSAIIAGYTLGALARGLLIGTAIFLVALVAGMHIRGDGVDLAALGALALLLSLASSLWATGMAMRLRSTQAGPAIQIPVFLTLFFAPVYVPLHLLTGAMHAIAAANPATAFLQAGRALINGTPAELALAYGLGAALAIAFALWALRSLGKAESAV